MLGKELDFMQNVIRKKYSENDRQIKQNKFVTADGKEGEYLTFPLLEEFDCVKHLFTTRLGGVSQGIFSTMNVSFTRGDNEEAVIENYRRIAMVLSEGQKVPYSLESFVCSDQTHTTNVRVVTKEDAGKGVVSKRDYRDVDGLITNEKGLILSTFYADCVPLYFVDPIKEVIGLSHSGWRGTVGKMGKVTVEKMKETFGCKPNDIYAAIGPSICQECYEVSEDVAEEFKTLFENRKTLVNEEIEGENNIPENNLVNELLLDKGNGKYQLNLWRANYEILREAGILEEHIQMTDVCTCCNPEYLFSHRASQGKRGNLGAFLVLT